MNTKQLEFIGELLTCLELDEVRLMEWGFFDVVHTDVEIIDLFESNIKLSDGFRDLVGNSSGELFIDDLATAGLLYRIGTGVSSTYRSRFAESMRLMVRLRQRFTDQDWNSAPELVSDARFFLAARRFPVRDVNFSNAWNVLSSVTWQKVVQRKVLESLMGMTTSPILLSAFQLRSAERILQHYRGSERPTGTVVTAGTGGGKTKAFYIPALMGISSDICLDSRPSTKVLSVYPRNVLLADQFGEAIDLVMKVSANLGESLPRSIRVGCLIGDVPFSSNFEGDVRNKKAIEKWVRPLGVNGRRLPHLRDRESGKALVWMDSDRRSGKTTLRFEDDPSRIAIPDGVVVLTRDDLMSTPPDIFLTSIEMINKELSSELGVKVLGFGTSSSALRLVLLDEIHTYEGLTGAQVPWILRRLSFWTKVGKWASYHVVGLSATLQDAPSHLATLTGISEGSIEEVTPRLSDQELTIEGQEYNVVLKSHPGSGAGVLATSIQTVMLGSRLLTPLESPPPLATTAIDSGYFFGKKLFGFTDNLDVVNRWFPDYYNAEKQRRLARLRLPKSGDDPQWEGGQSWRICRDLHHDLNNSMRIGKTSSTDPGVDSQASIVLATSALEVGFDDDEVGMIVQHKAPFNAASFLQRKGRAGRRKGMRPWTIVVLSEFGRDRWAFRDSERLFTPVLDRLSVPVFNPYVLRIQATWFLVDWIAKKFGQKIPSLYLARKKYFEPVATQIVEDLLTQENCRAEFACDLTEWIRFAQGGVRVSDPEALANDILWNPPRSVFRQVIPNLWNYLKGDQSIVHQSGPVPLLPRFLPQRTWQVLDTQDVDLQIQGSPGLESMDVRRALFEVTPGRVSRRFSPRRDDTSKWMAWSNKLLESTTPTKASVDELFSDFVLNEDLDGVSIYQPTFVELVGTPHGVKKMSTASWQWECQIFTLGDPGYLTLHTGPVARSIFDGGSVWMHRERSWIQTYRYSGSFRFDLHQQRKDPVRGFVSIEAPVAGKTSRRAVVGYVRSVDGIELRVRPEVLANQPILNTDVIASLKPLYLRFLASQSEVLRRRTSVFEMGSLVTSALGMLCASGLRNQLPLEDAWQLITNRPSAAGKVLSTILSGETPLDPDEDSESTGVQEIVELWKDQEIAAEMDALVANLWGPLDASWSNWLQSVLLESIRSAVEASVQSVLPETPDSDFTVEVIDQEQRASIWILERESGGIGVIDRLLSEVGASPNLFDTALESCLINCSSERVEKNIFLTIENSIIDTSPIKQAFSEVRNANNYAEIDNARESLISSLKNAQLEHDKSALTALLGKALMRGSTSKTDRWIRRLSLGRIQVSNRLGIDVDPKVWAYCTITDERRNKLFARTLEEIYGTHPTDRQMTASLVRLTLNPCFDSCASCLGNPRELDGIGSSRRLSKQWLNLTEVDNSIDVDSASEWVDDLHTALIASSRIKLRFSNAKRTLVCTELSARLANRIDRGYSLSAFRISSMTRVGDTWELLLRVDDMEAT